ncbi:hypothetical protein H920_03499 [Fukomys damarensis]|uniref:Uncharacterized protein n=1 Tax=Fukomys damarensis TaxID=885580 RepID=A0A091EI00_FUKDA|nr:hypothetical protein H920_03499 [Fukomys damarensis]
MGGGLRGEKEARGSERKSRSTPLRRALKPLPKTGNAKRNTLEHGKRTLAHMANVKVIVIAVIVIISHATLLLGKHKWRDRARSTLTPTGVVKLLSLHASGLYLYHGLHSLVPDTKALCAYEGSISEDGKNDSVGLSPSLLATAETLTPTQAAAGSLPQFYHTLLSHLLVRRQDVG